MSEPHAVHGMGRELTEPDWPPLTDDELRGVLAVATPASGAASPQ